MTYAAPFAYASKAILPDPYAPNRPHRKVRHRHRRLRIRAALLTAVNAGLSR